MSSRVDVVDGVGQRRALVVVGAPRAARHPVGPVLDVGDPLKAAKDELVKACTAYAKAAGRDAKEVMVEATKLACFEKTPAGYRATAQHYAKLMGEA